MNTSDKNNHTQQGCFLKESYMSTSAYLSELCIEFQAFRNTFDNSSTPVSVTSGLYPKPKQAAYFRIMTHKPPDKDTRLKGMIHNNYRKSPFRRTITSRYYQAETAVDLVSSFQCESRHYTIHTNKKLNLFTHKAIFPTM